MRTGFALWIILIFWGGTVRGAAPECQERLGRPFTLAYVHLPASAPIPAEAFFARTLRSFLDREFAEVDQISVTPLGPPIAVVAFPFGTHRPFTRLKALERDEGPSVRVFMVGAVDGID